MRVTMSKCALCGVENENRLSHIIPKFVFRYLKETSPGYLRSTEHPNAIAQDGEKHYMLCSRCEELFSVVEKRFSDNLFYPYMREKQRRFEYDVWLYDFITSLSWRHLYLDIMDFVKHDVVGINALEYFIGCERIMREYLLGQRDDIGNIEHHLFFFDDIVSATGELADLNPHSNIHRSVTGYSAANEGTETYFTICNILGLVFVSIYKKGKDEKWINTKISRGQSVIEAKEQQITSVVSEEFTHIMRSSEQGKAAISRKQQDAIKERFYKAMESNKQYPIFDDLEKDHRLKNG